MERILTEKGVEGMTEKRYYLENFKDFTVITLRLYDRKIKHKHYDWLTESHKIVDLINKLNDENEEFKKALMELKEIGDYQEGRIKELSDENEQLESELKKIVEVCRKYGIYKEELQYVLADYDKMLNENGERAIRYKYCVNSR